jgi:predicted nucleic acid-binding protein
LTGYLVDTSFLSVFSPDRPPIHPRLQSWISEERQRGAWYLPAIAVVEIERGVAKLKRIGGHSKARRISLWFEQLLAEFEGRVLSVDQTIAKEAGRLEDAAMALGRNPGLADVLIAATARLHDLSVLTANSRHFAVLSVRHLNPVTDIGPLSD